MKITVEFANLNEFKQYMGVESPNLLAQASKEPEDAPAPAEAVQEPQKAPEDPAPKKNTKKVEKTAPAEAEPSPESADEAAPAAPAAPAEVTEDFRITVRKQLAALNKKRGYNRAAELINEQTGKGKLTEVALADLPKLMEAAKEETNAD